jgi:hemoglobin
MDEKKSLYIRLGAYDGIAALAKDLAFRLATDPLIGRFWAHRGHDGLERETHLLVDFVCHCTGGPMAYIGRNMRVTHKGMRIGEADWSALRTHLHATLDRFGIAEAESAEVLQFVESIKSDLVEV